MERARPVRARARWIARAGRWVAWTARLAMLRTLRKARLLVPDRNPLRRRIDRLEAVLVAVLAALFLAIAPVAAMAAGNWAHAVSARQEAAQRGWRQQPAVLMRAAPLRSPGMYQGSWGSLWEPVSWTGPGGRARTGWAQVPPGTPAGTVVRVWVDGAGLQTRPPLRPGEVASRVAGAEVLAPICLGVLLLGIGATARWRLNKRRIAAWDSAWASIGPRWTRHS